MISGALKPSLWFPGANLSHPMLNHLVGAWLFLEGDGDVLLDLSGHHNATWTGQTDAPHWVPDAFGYASPWTDGAPSDYITIGDHDVYAPGVGGFTVWVRMKTTSVAGRLLIGKSTVGSLVDWWSITGGSETSVEFDDGVTKVTLTGAAMNDGEWHDIVLTRTPGVGYVLYVDGVSVDTNADNASVDATGPLNIGGNIRTVAGADWFGSIDSAMIWRRGLTAGEVAELCSDLYRPFRLDDDLPLWVAATSGAAPPAGNPWYGYAQQVA